MIMVMDDKIMPNQPRILIVEDNRVNSLFYSQMMEMLGAEVSTASCGNEAYDKLLENEFDLILLDINMPDLDGVSLYHKLLESYQQQKRQLPPIVVMSAFEPEVIEDQVFLDGVRAFKIKPLVKEDLQNIYEDLFNQQNSGNPLAIDDDAFNRILKLFKQKYADSAARFREMQSSGDTEGIKALAHKLKGSSGNIKLSTINSLAAKIENALAMDDKKELAELFDKLEKEIDQY